MGGGIRIGNTCKPMAVSFQCMTKSTTIKIIIIIKKKRFRTELKLYLVQLSRKMPLSTNYFLALSLFE